jgi:hypothetical protein
MCSTSSGNASKRATKLRGFATLTRRDSDMDQAARAAFIASQIACMQARLAAMMAQNVSDEVAGRPLTYLPQHFDALPDQFQLGHNAVVTYLMGN